MHKNFPFWIIVYEIILYLSSDIYFPAVLMVQKDLQATEQETLLTISIWFIGNVIFSPFIGFISTLFGRRNIIVLGALLFGLLNVNIFFIKDPRSLIIFRFLQGSLTPLLMVPGYAAIHDYFSDKKAIKILAWMNSTAILGPLLGPLIGSYLLFYVSWKVNFFALGIAAFCLVIPLFMTIPTIFPKESHHEGATVKHKKPLSIYMIYLIGVTLAIGSNITWLIASPLILMNEFGLTPVGYGLMQLFICSGFIIGAFIINRFIAVYDIHLLFVYGKWFMAISTFLFSFLLFLPKSLFFLVNLTILLAGALGYMTPIFARIVMTSYFKEKDLAASIMTSFVNLGTIIGSLLALFFYQQCYMSIVDIRTILGWLVTGLFILEYAIDKKHRKRMS